MQYCLIGILITGFMVGIVGSVMQLIGNSESKEEEREEEQLFDSRPVWANETKPQAEEHVVPVETGPVTLQDSFSMNEEEL